jgi:hypothetical protein
MNFILGGQFGIMDEISFFFPFLNLILTDRSIALSFLAGQVSGIGSFWR